MGTFKCDNVKLNLARFMVNYLSKKDHRTYLTANTHRQPNRTNDPGQDGDFVIS